MNGANEEPANQPKSNLNSSKIKGKSVSSAPATKEKTVAPKTPPLIMNHITTQRNEVDSQNVNEVEEMDTQEGKWIPVFFVILKTLKSTLHVPSFRNTFDVPFCI